jgi:lipoprotein-releasing system permease protein
MSLAYLIARRLYRDTDGGRRVSRPAVLIALTGIAIGLAVMIVTVAIVTGFKGEVRDKIVGFGAHLQIGNLNASRSYESLPVQTGDSLLAALAQLPEVQHVERFSTKLGMIKTDDDFQGIVLKGVGQEFDPTFFRQHLLEGEMPQFTDTAATGRVLISRHLADKLRLHLGDRIDTYYLQNDIRARRLTIAGIYQTHFYEYDNLFLLTDLYTVNRLSGWQADQAGGIEVMLHDYSRLKEAAWDIGTRLEEHTDAYGETYVVQDIEQLTPQIFAWLGILDVNIWVILILMIGVAGFTIVSGLLIIIIERTSMIGVLKSLGADNTLIRRIFLWFALFLIGKGMVWGNVIGLGFYAVQHWLGVFKLDPAKYYMDTVPVSLNVWFWLLLNVGTLLVALLMLIGPSYIITRIHPAQSMRYE